VVKYEVKFKFGWCNLSLASTAALVVPATRHSTLGDWPLGFSHHSRQAVELTARRHHHCNISVNDFST